MIPDALTSQTRWILWRYAKRGAHTTKEPIAFRTGRLASTTNPADWASYSDVARALSRTPGAWSGPGLVLGAIKDGNVLAGIDLDCCLSDETIAEWAVHFLNALPSYTEVSPSGSGLKIFFVVAARDLYEFRRALGLSDKENGRKRTYGSTSEAHPPAAEIYLSARYFAVTGQHWSTTPGSVLVADRDSLTRVASLFGAKKCQHEVTEAVDLTAPDENALRAKLKTAAAKNERLRSRLAGRKDDLSDQSRSGFDMSLGSLLKASGFNYSETRLVLVRNPHGAGKEKSEAGDERYFQRIWQRSELSAPRENDCGAPALLDATDAASVPIATAAAQQQPTLDDALDAALRGMDDPPGLSTGMHAVDDALNGLERATLNILAGRPGMGKTSLAVQWAIHAARQGVGVAVYSLEMSAAQIGRRILCSAAGVPLWVVRKRCVSLAQAEAMVLARDELRGLPVTIDDLSGLTVREISDRTETARKRHGLGLIVVDHLHIVRPEERDSRSGPAWAVGKISAALKGISKEYECPVLALAQLNRGVEGRDDKRPTLADLRYSGDIEQDADTVMFLYREEYYMREPVRRDNESAEAYERSLATYHDRKEKSRGLADLIVAKARDGEPAVVRLKFRGETATFSEDQR